jgi:hypothetical protein
VDFYLVLAGASELGERGRHGVAIGPPQTEEAAEKVPLVILSEAKNLSADWT